MILIVRANNILVNYRGKRVALSNHINIYTYINMSSWLIISDKIASPALQVVVEFGAHFLLPTIILGFFIGKN